jgi:hypothetical protein
MLESTLLHRTPQYAQDVIKAILILWGFDIPILHLHSLLLKFSSSTSGRHPLSQARLPIGKP